MGIVNCTPDSFSDGGQFRNFQEAIDYGLKLFEEGADILDIGGESTRPGSRSVTVEKEMQRVLPVLEGLAKKIDIPLSIDTQKASVAKMALNAGATIINDVSSGNDPSMFALAAQEKATLCLMHKKGTPETMQKNPFYENPLQEIYSFLQERSSQALKKGVERSKIWIDPGIGFGKRVEDNLELLHRLGEFQELGCPILIGASRKSFIGTLTGAAVENRLPGSLAAAALAVRHGAQILRVHDVAATKQFLQIFIS